MDELPQSAGLKPETLLREFKLFSVKQLMEAGDVCNKFRDIANHPSLWKVVRVTDSNNLNFKDMANMLKKHGTRHLNLSQMWHSDIDSDRVWQEFVSEMKTVNSLTKLEMGRCPAFVVEKLLSYNPNLIIVKAPLMFSMEMNISCISFLTNLQELTLMSLRPDFRITSDLTALCELKNLKHLALISIENLKDLQVSVIGDLVNLESLELGDFVNLPDIFCSEVLTKLEKLKKLRLVGGQGHSLTFAVLKAVKDMKQLAQLELINFEIIYTGFDLALGECKNIKKLLIIPSSYSHGMVNRMIFGGVLRLRSMLTHFYWGVTQESAIKMESFLKRYETAKEKFKKRRLVGLGGHIPIQMPLPLLKNGVIEEVPPIAGLHIVEFLPIRHCEDLLKKSLPGTRVRILKIPVNLILDYRFPDGQN